jgi:hypothetical protein
MYRRIIVVLLTTAMELLYTFGSAAFRCQEAQTPTKRVGSVCVYFLTSNGPTLSPVASLCFTCAPAGQTQESTSQHTVW